MRIHFGLDRLLPSQLSPEQAVRRTHKRRSCGDRNTSAPGRDLRYSKVTLPRSHSLRIRTRLLWWMCLPVLLVGMPGLAAVAQTPQFLAAAGASWNPGPSSALAAEQPERVAEQSVATPHIFPRHILQPHISLLQNHPVRSTLNRLGDDDDVAYAQHQHRRFGMEAGVMRGEVLPVRVARLRGLQEQFPSAAVFPSSGRDPPIRLIPS